MKSIGIILSLLLFFSPRLAHTQIPAQNELKSTSKKEIKVNLSFPKSGIKIISALAKTGIGLALIAACSYVAILAVCEDHDYKAIWCTIENEKANGKMQAMERINILPALRIGIGIACGMGIATGLFAINSASNDLQSLNAENNE